MLASFVLQAAENVVFFPENLLTRSHTKILKKSKPMLSVKENNDIVSLFRIDTGCLNQIPSCRIEKLSFSFCTTFFKGSGGGKLEFRPLKKSIAEYETGVPVELEDLADMNSSPLFSFQLPVNLEKLKTRYTIPLPAEKKIFEALGKGVVVSLNSGGSKLTQINIAGCQRIKGSTEYYPKLSLDYSTPAEKLKFSRHVKIIPGKFVTKKGADFYYNGAQIRLFGANIGVSFASHAEIDMFVDRLLAMNIGAVRAWLYVGGSMFVTKIISEKLETEEFTPSAKGDGSYWDCTDYFFARLQKEGIFVDSTMLMSVPKSVSSEMDFWYAHTCVSDRYRAYRINHIRKILNRVNLYTGQRYAEMPVFATWELHNELGTVPRIMSGWYKKWAPAHQELLREKWNAWLLKKYKNTAALKKKWGQLNESEDPVKGTVTLNPVYGEEDKYPKQRGIDFLNFVQSVFIEANRELEAAARACAPKEVGINTAPIVHTTHTAVNLHGQYADSMGDFTACGIYQSPYTKDKKNPFYPFSPFVTRRPYFYNINFQTSANKPFMIYEASFHRPYKYRVEFIPVLGLLGAGLGWDALYFYTFNSPSPVGGSSPLFFSAAPIAVPYAIHQRGYTSAFRSASDEVVMATLAVTGQAFTNGIAPNREETRITFGKGAILNHRFRNYGPRAVTTDPVFTELVGGGVMEYFMMPGMYRKMIDASVRTKLTVDFNLKQEAPIRVEGKPLAEIKDDTMTLNASPDITWNPKKSVVILDNRHSKILTGVLPEVLKFKDGVVFHPDKSMFAFFGMSSRDGKPLAESKEIVFALTSESQNTGYKLNPEKMISGPLALIPAIENRGTAPVIVTRPSGTIHVPGAPFTLKRYNFAGYCYKTEQVKNGRFAVLEGEPLFLGVITRK